MDIQATVYSNEVHEVIVNGQRACKLDSYGHCRQVFTIGDDELFIKFDNPNMYGDETGIQTQLELENLCEIEEEDKKYFCLPLAWGEVEGLWYTVQQGVRNEVEPTEQDIEELDAIITKYELVGDVGCTGWGTHNCVLTKDGWKIYDYALKD